MLDSLRISGFRAFAELEISRLGRVSLVVGRNNVGKTTVLEAVHLHASGAQALAAGHRMLERRDEFSADEHGTVDPLRLFYVDAKDERRASATIADTSGHDPLDISTAWAWWEVEGEGTTRRIGEVPPPGVDAQAQLVARRRGRLAATMSLASFGNELPFRRLREGGSSSLMLPADGFRSEQIHAPDLWDGVVLTEREERVVDLLRVIEPGLERIVMVNTSGSIRSPMAKVRGRAPLPLRSLGDGMSRLFELAVGLVSVGKGGTFLVDEADAGLHFTTLADVWRLIFDAAARLDVQVLATTHSWDCIEAFQLAAAAHPAEGVLVRLQRSGDAIGSEVFTEEDLAIVARESIEVR
jgi:hypothetical protein